MPSLKNLYTALMLYQNRRAGDLNQITQAQALAVVDQWKVEGCPPNKGYQIRILAGKHAKFAKHATGTIHAPLFRLFMYYTINVRCQFPTHSTTPNWKASNSLDSVDAQGKLKSGSITKLYRKLWDAFATEIGMTLPKLSRDECL